jgi:hypothetical protein
MAMKVSFVLGAAVGYVLGTRAGRERYETIVRLGRKVAGSQTVQSSAGVLQAQVEGVKDRAMGIVAARLHHDRLSADAPASVNGYHS